MCGLFVWPSPRCQEPVPRSQDQILGQAKSPVSRIKLGFSKMERTNKRHSHMRHEKQKQQRRKVAAGIYGWFRKKKKNKNEKVKAKTIPDARKLRIQWRAKSRTYKQIHSHKGKHSERWCRVHLEKIGVGHKIIFLEFEKEIYHWYII